MVAEDIAAFDSLMAAYKLPKATDEEKSRRAEAIQAGLERATEVPLECARACAHVVAMARRAANTATSTSSATGASASRPRTPRCAARRSTCTSTRPPSRTAALPRVRLEEVKRLAADSALDSEATYAAVRSKLES